MGGCGIAWVDLKLNGNMVGLVVLQRLAPFCGEATLSACHMLSSISCVGLMGSLWCGLIARLVKTDPYCASKRASGFHIHWTVTAFRL